jgi:hypothetical protein
MVSALDRPAGRLIQRNAFVQRGQRHLSFVPGSIAPRALATTKVAFEQLKAIVASEWW